MTLKKYMDFTLPNAMRLSVASLTIASTVALPFTAWPEDPLPPIDPIWNKAKIEPERSKKSGGIGNAATRATVGTSADNAEEGDYRSIRDKRNKEKIGKEDVPQDKLPATEARMTLDTPEKETMKVDIIRAQDFPVYKKAAEEGDNEGMRLTGICYLYGTGTQKDERKGWEWIGKAASAGNTEAQYDLGCLYRDGLGVRQNYDESAYWFRRAARNGHGKAMLNIARQFAEGKGVLQDYRIAAENFWRAAERGEPEGMYQYAVMLRDGIGVDRNQKKALKWFEEASKQDYKDAKSQAEALRKTSSRKN